MPLSPAIFSREIESYLPEPQCSAVRFAMKNAACRGMRGIVSISKAVSRQPRRYSAAAISCLLHVGQAVLHAGVAEWPNASNPPREAILSREGDQPNAILKNAVSTQPTYDIIRNFLIAYSFVIWKKILY
jgi:hypothetical protein